MLKHKASRQLWKLFTGMSYLYIIVKATSSYFNSVNSKNNTCPGYIIYICMTVTNVEPREYKISDNIPLSPSFSCKNEHICFPIHVTPCNVNIISIIILRGYTFINITIFGRYNCIAITTFREIYLY